MTIRLWNVKERQQLGPFINRGGQVKTSVAFSHDGKTLASCSEGGIIHLLDTNVQECPKRARSIANRNFGWEEWKEFFKGEEYRKTFPELPADPLFVREKLNELKGTRLSGPELRSAYEEIVRLALVTDDANVNNNACWRGSCAGFAGIVLPAGERAVTLAPGNALYRDTRGLARALTGDRNGAIEDFRFYVKAFKRDPGRMKSVKQREEWIAALEAGQNPFDETTLAAIRNQ
jgi:hypothetical protein